MTEMMRQTRFPLLFRLIRLIGVIVPRRLRADWRQEWEAELLYREELLSEWGSLNRRGKLALLWHSLGAFADALWLQPRRWEDEMFQDLRYGARMLLKDRAFTIVAVLTLALGIGANTAIFSVVDAVLLRPLPYRDPERLVKVFETNPQRQLIRFPASLADFQEWRKQSHSFDDMAFYLRVQFRANDGQVPEDIEGDRVSANLFSFLGTQAALGRVFLPEDESPDAEPVVMLGHQYWVSHFGAAQNVIGQTIRLNNQPHVIVGVLPADFREIFESIPGRAQVWAPARLRDEEIARRAPRAYFAMARLKPGVGIEQARAEMTAIADRIAQAYPNSNKGIGATVFPLREEVTRNSSQTLLTLLAAFGFVLLIACANVANLLLARGVERSKEIAVRAAIGAGRWRLIRQLITETTLLALSGGVCAILLAKWMLAGVMPLIPRDVSRTDGIAINLRAMFFTLTAALLCSLLCGLAPATQTAKVNLTETLKDAGYGTAGGRRSRAWRSSLIVLQLALTTVLLVGAGLLTNSLVRLYRTDPGLDGQNLLTMSLSLKRGKGDGPPLWNEFWNSLVEKARGLPGVQDAALVYSLPLSDSPSGMSVGIPGGVAKKPNEAAGCYFNTVSHNYFRLLGIGLRRGRNFSDVDKADSPPAVVINESFARSYFTGQEPLGKTITIDRGSKTEKEAVVIGVVADSHARLDEPIQPTIYLSLLQYPQSSMYLVARTATDPAGYFGAMRNLVSALNKDLPAGQSRTMTEIRATYTARPRFYLSLLGSLAILAASLSAVGIYGVLSHGINQRRHEIGVRRALGAQDGDVRGLVIRQGMALAAIGVIVGLGGALALTRLMRGWLYEVSATDPLTFLLVAGALLLVALAACYAPARRATAVDPMAALRNQ